MASNPKPKTGNSRSSKPGGKTPDFEKSLAALEELVERMEGGEQSLEDALKDFEKGIELTRHCQESLRNAELKVRQLLERSGLEGGEQLEPFDNPGNNPGEDN